MDEKKTFFPRKQTLAPDADGQERQRMMELCLRDVETGVHDFGGSSRIIGLMHIKYVDCCGAQKSLTMGFPVEDWELNPGNTMHGGMIATAVDSVMGLASHYFSDCLFTPTISMDINYIKPVFAGDVLEVTAQVVHSGRRVCFVKAEGRRRSDGKTAVTAQGSYMVSE